MPTDFLEKRPADGDGLAAESNRALWLTAKQGALEVTPAPLKLPRNNEIVVRNRALGINPVDWMAISVGSLFFPWLKYPFILGSDVAGEVVAVGEEVTRFNPGDRVLGHAIGAEKSHNNPAEGAFQTFTVLQEHMMSPIPPAISYEQAAVLPLGLSTAACALFLEDYLALLPPSNHIKKSAKTVLVWGSSSSVGSNAVQLAVAAGYEVIATASPKNFEFAKTLGASLVFDYRSPTVVADVIAAFKDRAIAGAIAIGLGSAAPCIDIVNASTGNKAVAMTSAAVSFANAPSGFLRPLWLMSTLTRMVFSTAALMIKARMRGIKAKFIWGGALAENDLSRIIYGEFLPDALADGRFVPSPQPVVTGRGLEAIPNALQRQREGVSAQKIVVTL